MKQRWAIVIERIPIEEIKYINIKTGRWIGYFTGNSLFPTAVVKVIKVKKDKILAEDKIYDETKRFWIPKLKVEIHKR